MTTSLADLMRRTAIVAGLAFTLAPFATSNAATAEEIIVTITHVKALDKIDALSKADFMARVTIGGERLTTDAVKNLDNIRPNWVIRKRVSEGTHDVKLEILDKDVSKNDLIDINKVANKRDLDFKVNTRNCNISGFSGGYSCGDSIKRAGEENRRAEVTFKVEVRR